MYFNCHTHHYRKTPDCLELVNEYPHDFKGESNYFSVGIHPWFIDFDRLENDFRALEKLIQKENCLAVGECGLDKKIETDFEKQIEIFEKQLLLAEKYQKPVILHCVSAYQEMVAIKSKLNISVPMILHGFLKKKQLADDMVSHGFYLSFGKHLIKNENLEETFLAVPEDRFFLETDMDENLIESIYEKASEYKKIETKTLIKNIQNTCNQVFKLNL
ncbi:TatD family deoxyribonuclease [Flavobacterium sp. NST-5]|uniref:TatD family deoxyribonuclease n=1 Tax=Flavobacterium ichthyis TaxID=2698827 RepID=A0ABW9ZDE6_9FLAO|nr:TatD family hydrolase [Flavobacterium ichthyis]NBL65130.1 TatD family deoxyribonuclease [Flavobacterium ichthyis]